VRKISRVDYSSSPFPSSCGADLMASIAVQESKVAASDAIGVPVAVGRLM